jgi:ABC-type amino acid transport substrate-binding protein
MALCALLGLIAASPLAAQDSETTAQDHATGAASTAPFYRVGIIESPPFVINADTDPSGMAIDLWESTAQDRGFDFTYTVYPSIRAILDAVVAKEIDIAVADMTITSDRAEVMSFTQPFFDGGLRIMVDSPSLGGLQGLIDGLSEAGFLRYYLWIGGAIIFGTLGFTLFDRRFSPGFPTSWREGLAEGFYTVMLVATTGKPPKRSHLFGWIGRIFQAAWLVVGVAVVAFVTSSVTSVMTVHAFSHQINSLADLPGKNVAVLDGSVAQKIALKRGLDVWVFDSLAEATDALHSDEIDALVGDAPVLEYYAHTHPEDSLEIVGPIFNPLKYGFAMPLDSPLRYLLTLEVLDAHEEEIIDLLRNQYFGPRD